MKKNINILEGIDAEVEITSTPHGQIVTSLTLIVDPDNPTGVTTKTLRSITSKHLTGDDSKESALEQIIRLPLPSKGFSSRSRRRLTDEEISSIANVYRLAMKNNLPPTKVLTLWLKLPKPTVSRYIKMARRRGLLSNTYRSGRPSI